MKFAISVCRPPNPLQQGLRALFFEGVFALAVFAPCFSEGFQKISELSARDAAFKEFCQCVEQNYRAVARGEPPDVKFFSYRTKEGDSLFKIASRCSIPYDAVASLNSIPSASSLKEEKSLFLPTAPGIFVGESPETGLDSLLFARFGGKDGGIGCEVGGRKFSFFSDERLSPTERAFFLDGGMGIPLPKWTLTSRYGMRVSPISGKKTMHGGVDLAAPDGTPVSAAKAGVVAEIGESEIYGNYIVIRHSDGLETLYGHLSKTCVSKGGAVVRGEKIGEVGSTGASTGPHLHFEVRANGWTKDINKMFSENNQK